MESKKKYNFERLFWLCMIIITMLLSVFPVYIMLKYSISDKASWVTGGKYPVPWWPFHPNLESFKYYISDKRFWANGYLSLQIALLTVFLSVLVGAPCAYALTRFRFPAAGVLVTLILSIRMLPDIASVIPVAKVFNDSFIYYLPIGLKIAVVHCLIGLPYVIFIAQGIFETVPKDLDEQAYTLGAGKLYTFIRIILPLVVPGLAAGAIYVFMLSWNEFVYSYFISATSSTAVVPLPVYLKSLFGVTAPSPVALTTISLLVSFPVIIFTFFVQKYIVSGMTAGAVK